MNRNQILHAAVETFGRESQMMMMVEEMSELTKAISKFYRAKDIDSEADAVDNIKEEIADCEIMLEQMKILFGNVDMIERQKLSRLEKRIAEQNEMGV